MGILFFLYSNLSYNTTLKETIKMLKIENLQLCPPHYEGNKYLNCYY